MLCRCGCGNKTTIYQKRPRLFIHGHNSKGKFHYSYKGKIKRGKYWYLFLPNHPYSNKQGYIAEHRVVMEKKLGRYLRDEECVDHIDREPTNNNPENLRIFLTHGQHTKLAHSEIYRNQRKNKIYSCRNCKKEFMDKPYTKRKFCSVKCSLKYHSSIISKTRFKKGMIPWNKQRPFWTEEMKKKLSGENSPHFIHGRYSKYI